MARVRSVDFLPEIFQTPVNKQFLAATLDQLVQEPKFQKTQGFVGRRVGPGVNADDRYVVEPTPARNNYQLEPGVISLEPDSNRIRDAITYPGISDALELQGAYGNNSNRLYTSDYYAWDPFVDFDKYVNYQQYYWLPDGPLEVDVSSTVIPTTDNFVVTRENGVYTFSGVGGNNPTLTLARGGNYTFQVAQNAKEDVNYRVTNSASSAYVIDFQTNPTLTLVRGNTYTFTLVLDGIYPFYIKTEASLGNVNAYNSGVTNNGAVTGTVTFVVPQDAPDVLYYSSATQFNMRGAINIVNGTPGTGPGFWIQTDPGVTGQIIATPNISSRSVLGVLNNGEDLGTVQFNVPLKTAQDFYYTLPSIGAVQLLTNLQFDQIDGQSVQDFNTQRGGIDGITDLQGRSLVFEYTATGWGGVLEEQRYGIWRIEYVNVLGTDRIQLISVTAVSNFEKFVVQFGSQWASTGWYKTAEGIFQQIPLLSAVNDTVYYQDGTDPEIFGQIKLVDQDPTPRLDIDDIVGRKNYTSPNGVVFTNGLKVVFRGNVEPTSYVNNSYYVEGVGTAIRLLPVTNFVTPEPYVEEEYVLLNSEDSTLGGPPRPDYLTIGRASLDLNPWSRSNRWFHVDVINYSYELNDQIPVLDNSYRGRRPVLEFRAGTRLFNFGTEGKQPINVIDFNITDALSTINGTIGYGIDGYSFEEGTRVVFAADTDPEVRNKIYQVEFIIPDSIPPLITQPVINLVLAPDATVLIDQSTVCLSGNTLQGKSFYFDGVTWILAQEKTAVNQAPRFDVYDSSGISFGDRIKYPSSTFIGSKLLSYANGSGVPDPVLGFVIKYLNLSNIGDIVFDNNLYTDTFVYVEDNQSATRSVSQGYVREYVTRTDFTREIGWQTAATPSLVRQQFRFTYSGTPLKLDIPVSVNNVVPAVQLYVASQFQSPDKYTVAVAGSVTTITLLEIYVPGDIIEVAVLSGQVSAQGFYQVPVNLENNPLNVNSSTFTLGTVRSHYGSIGENLLALQGPINGANNSRDLGNIVPYGLQILQQSSPLTLAGYFARNLEYDIFASIEYNMREYIKYKNLLLETVIRNEYNTNATIADILDLAIADITQGRTDINPFYWSDMLPSSAIYTQTQTTITPITTSVFDTVQTYDFTSANFKAVLVYLTRGEDTVLLTRHTDYTVSTDGPTLTVNLPLQVGDVVTIREYANTAGNFCPNTPSKMGLYPKYLPRVFVDPTYVNPTTVIQGHDGSITVAFGDIRDQILLEFEKRIYNNSKTDGNPVPLTAEQVIPGAFRTTDYTQSEITSILGGSFLSWVGWNKVDYKTQNYVANNAFTWNYSGSGSKLNDGTINNVTESQLLGAWRGIYRYFYDTISPDTRPWEMLGFTEKPTWWETRYGPAPYTSDNLVLWDDLELGLVADPVTPYILPEYARPGLTQVIPVDSEGQLLSPAESVMGQTDPTSYRKSWTVGDGGPTESSWWTSSSYPFAVMRLLALTRPAEFFSLFADRDLYRFSEEFGQYLYQNRYRLDANGVEIYGSLNVTPANNETIVGVSKASYINWIVDYNQQLGRNSTADLTRALQNLDVRLCYRMASFTNKQYLKIFTEKSSPDSQNSSLLLPDESYKLLLYKNQPFADIAYSAVIVERVPTGFAVYGYSNIQPYFEILASASSGVLRTVSAGGTLVRVPTQYTNTIVQVPYGYVFTNTTMVVDFLLSYGAYLTRQGLIFNDRYNGYELNWDQMAQEFLYFSQQGWATGTLINLNPSASKITAFREGAVVDTIESVTPENMLLDQNRTNLPTRDLIIERNENTFSATSVTGQTISYLRLKFTSYEHMVVLDNVSVFADLIYDPATAARQYRVRITAATTTEWNGILDAQGFILNENNVREWQANRKYTKGEIVLYKNIYWAAQTIVQPKRLFDYNDWVKADYTLIQEGLLPNLANKADQLANSYNINTANLERDNDLLSYGLIGFRPREYMTALNLDDVSQVNVYQQFLGSKGTRRAAELFTRADLGKEAGEYAIYENWAVLAGTYGANANRSFFELRLNEAQLQSNPSTIQVVLPQQNSDADQTVLLENVWRESYKLTSPEILPTTYDTTSDTALPSAGYVNVDDIDITVFSLDDPANIAQSIESVGIGTIIWVAKTNNYDWNVYRCERVPGVITQVTDNLNETSVATFSAAHDLVVGDLIIIRYFNNAVNGVYRVLNVPGIQQVVIAFNFINTNQTVITGTGLAFYLQTARVAQASDVVNLPYSNDLVPGAKVWVDDNGRGHWTVLEKQNPFTTSDRLTSEPFVANSRFGIAIAQSANNLAALVGAPGLTGDPGSVFTYLRNINGNYAFNINLALNATDVDGLGNSVAFGDITWSVVGASRSLNDAGYALVLYQVPGTNDYIYNQLLVSPDQDFSAYNFGHAVAMSIDERWMYITSPGANNVHAYARVDVELQRAVYTTDGVTNSFNYSNNIQIDTTKPNQLVLALENLLNGTNVDLVYAIDYTITATDVVLAETPSAGLRLTIARREAAQLDSLTYYGILQNITSGTGVNAGFTVNVTRGVYFPTLLNGGTGYTPGNTLTIFGSVIGGATPANDLVVTVATVSDVGAILTYTYTGSGNGTEDEFDLSEYLYTATNIESFIVTVNGQVQRPYLDYEFNNDLDPNTQDITFLTVPPVGAVISVRAAQYWKYVDTLTVPGLDPAAKFGISVTTTTDGRQVLIGAEQADVGAVLRAGSVYAFDRSVYRYLISDASQTTYVIPGAYADPVAVLLNGEFLTNTDQYVNGQFTVVGSNIELSADLDLTVGDVLEIETNQFRIIQTIAAENPRDEAKFGAAVEICTTNCSVYTGSPLASVDYPQEGQVQRNVNQSRVYGVITSEIANPNLTAGNNIRINNTLVAVPSAPDNTITGLIEAINFAAIPNVVATATPNVELNGNGITKIFDVGTVYSATSSYTTRVLVDNILQVEGVNYTYNNNTQQIIFVIAPGFGQIITVLSGRMTLNIINALAAEPGNKLTVLPGSVGTAFDDLEFETYVYTQTLRSPNPTDYANFGATLSIDSSAENLVVGAPNGEIYRPVTFDGSETYFDDRSTTFFSPVVNSGVAYTFDLLPSANGSITNPGKFVFGQQIYDTETQSNDQFGFGLNYRSGRLLVGAPGNDIEISDANYGLVTIFGNPTNLPSWSVLQLQEPVVNINQLNSVFMYDRLTSKTQTYFDYFNPLQGKILGVARRNIDYIGAVDPAQYNQGTVRNNGNSWSEEHVGEIWWDTDTVRFIDPNQDNITYASRRWGQIFPGSRVDIYQWTASAVPPVSYTGPGIPLSTVSYTVATKLNQYNIFETTYYFWVRGITTVDTPAGKTLSPVGIASYIENPRGSGIPYIAPLNASTVAIYNALGIISAADTILHIEFDRELTSANVHQEYQLIADGRADSFLNDVLYLKLLDSFCGANLAGNNVPDPLLSPAERYGVQFRPRQSMFVDRFAALKNYLERANSVLRTYPIVESRRLTLLNSSEPEPAAGSGAWNKRVANLEELSFQDLLVVPLGYKYLVASDSSQNGLWTIYEVNEVTRFGLRVLNLVRVQNYDTRKYWFTIDWYRPGYNSTITPAAEVVAFSELDTLSRAQVPIGDSAKVTANAQGKFEIYLRTELGWERVGLENGTIQISETIWNYLAGNFGFDVEVFDAQYFDQEPTVETRQIIRAINEELFIDDLAIERNRSLILMFNFVYSEFSAPEWLIKTSLVDVDHRIRGLLPFQNYLRDNQEFVLDYIQEVKPYHVQIREFNLTYYGDDRYPGMVTDFDVPAYYNSLLTVPQFVSPVLLPYTESDSFIQSNISDTPANAEIWTLTPWNEWFNNYLLNIQEVQVTNPGSGYTEPPVVLISGTCIREPVMESVINSLGQVVAVNVIDSGEGFSSECVIVFEGGNGVGARAIAVLGNDLVRTFRTTIKYDRYQYSSTIQFWQANVIYQTGDMVRYLDRVYSADQTVSSAEFDFEQWTVVPAETLNGIDRTQGYYVPTVNQPGLSLPLLIDGIDYPGVQVTGPLFRQNTGFDIGNFDINPFDNITIGADGLPTYDLGILDAIYRSSYLDVYLGTRPTDVNVDGGAYVDTYSSHAPEELVPGAEFDTLDLRVYTRSGSDWLLNGHGFPLESVRREYDPADPVMSWAGLVPNADAIVVSDITDNLVLDLDADYTVDWVNQTITIVSVIPAGTVIDIGVYGLGGGNQLYENTYNGADIIDNQITIPVVFSQIEQLAVFVNGQETTAGSFAVTWADTGPETIYNPNGSGGTTLVVGNTVGIQVGSLIVGTGFASGQTVVNKIDTTILIISAAPDTTPDGLLTFLDNTGQTTITFFNTYTSLQMLTITAIGPTTVDNSTIDYEWSTPVTQYIFSTGSTLTYELDNSLIYTNPVNLIVMVNGIRARTAAGIEHVGDGITSQFPVAGRLGVDQADIQDSEIVVYVDEILYTLGINYTVLPYNPFNPFGGRRVVQFINVPPEGSKVLLSVTTDCQVIVSGTDIVFQPVQGLVPILGDIISVITWNDTRQQDLLTTVFVGPVTIGVTITQGYDTTDFDVGVITNQPGSFDYSSPSTILVQVNDFQLGRPVINPDRLWVTLNGRRLFFGTDFVILGQELILSQGVIGTADVLMVTQMTESVVPEPMAFRIFQDMRGIQATYRITAATTTTLTQSLSASADVIYVADASALAQPNVNINIWGVVTIDGERIMYRERNTVINTISSLLRGTGGTGAANHATGAEVYDMGRGNLLPAQFQDYVVSDSTLSDGSTNIFSAPNIVTTIDDAVEVYVGGTRVLEGYSITANNPVTVLFDENPPEGVEVTILIRRGVTWYAPGPGTASNGVALQDTNTQAARFLRGLS
jgi:hypothetical protein